MPHFYQHTALSPIFIRIKPADLKGIWAEDYEDLFEVSTNQVCCHFCMVWSNGWRPYQDRMSLKKIWLDHQGNLLFEGFCKTCGKEVVRPMESGNDPSMKERAIIVRQIKIEVMDKYSFREVG